MVFESVFAAWSCNNQIMSGKSVLANSDYLKNLYIKMTNNDIVAKKLDMSMGVKWPY